MGKLSNYIKTIKQDYNSTANLILYNDAVTIIHDATKLCWDKPPEHNYNAKKDFIRRRVATGHESILEHGNIVMMITITPSYINDILEADFSYLNHFVDYNEENKTYNIIIGGSIRGYKHLFRMTPNLNNVILKRVADILYQITPREFWIDLIEQNILKDSFVQIMTTKSDKDLSEDFDELYEDYNELHRVKSTNEDLINILNLDDFSVIEEACLKTGFHISQLITLPTVTIKFNHMSRVITQQLIRHRNAITQASGRYIDLSDKVEFNAPDKFKEKYDHFKKYVFDFHGTRHELTLQELGDEICKIYPQLRNHDIDKEDARGYLPQNAQCGDIIMTFRLDHLIKFMELRRHPSAQAEIRMYANIIYASLIDILKEKLHINNEPGHLTDIYDLNKNIHELSNADNYDYSGIDEVIEENTEEITNEKSDA